MSSEISLISSRPSFVTLLSKVNFERELYDLCLKDNALKEKNAVLPMVKKSSGPPQIYLKQLSATSGLKASVLLEIPVDLLTAMMT